MKRLSMGVSCAPEIFQSQFKIVLTGLPGVIKMADDIVAFGKDGAKHKKRLVRVMNRL